MGPGEVERPFEGVASDAVAGAAIGFAFGGPTGALAGALVPVAERFAKLAHHELRAHDERAAAAWAIAAHETEHDVLHLLDAAEADPDRRHLAYTTADAAAKARYPARVVALGRALATGLLAEDTAVLDHEQLVVDALAVLDRPHILLLRQLVDLEGASAAPVFVRRTLSWSDLQSLASTRDSSLPRLLATLEREGLVHQETVAVLAADDGRPGDEERTGAYWRITDFGYDVLDRLWTAGVEDLLPSTPT